MTLIEALLLGVIQGITEFLPVSSSGHLVLFEHWFGLKVESLLAFDVVVHAGTLLALIGYFRRDLVSICDVRLYLKKSTVVSHPSTAGRQSSEEVEKEHSLTECPHLLRNLVVATVPVVLVAPFLKDMIETTFRGIPIVVGLLGFTAVLLASAELLGRYKKNSWLSWKVALVMGFFQIFALAPGVSRSGSTIVGGMMMGLSREKAARFSFLMAIPAITGALVFLMKDVIDQGFDGVGFGVLAVGFLSSAVVSALAVHFMLRFLKSRSLWLFVVYLVVLVAGFWLL